MRADGTHTWLAFVGSWFLFLLKVKNVVDGLHVTEDEHLILRGEPTNVAKQVVSHLVVLV